jgi:hypothetical protein
VAYVRRLAFEVCKGIVIDFGGGFLGLYENSGTADASPAAGTEANIRLWSDNWSGGASGPGFVVDGASVGVGAGAYTKGTIYFGPGANDYGTSFGVGIYRSSIAPNASGVAVDFGSNYGRDFFVSEVSGINCDPNASTGRMVNLGANGNITCFNRRPSSGTAWNEVVDKLVISAGAARSNRSSLRRDNTTFYFLHNDDTTAQGQFDSNGNWTFRGGITARSSAGNPSADGNAALNTPNGYGLSTRNAGNTADARVIRLTSGNQVALCETNCTGTTTPEPISVTKATGTAPLLISSTTEVANLNSERWHGKQALDFSGSLNFPSIAAQSCGELTITAAGAVSDSPVAPSWPASLEAGLSGIMYVSANDTVTVRLCNATSAAIDPANRTFAGRIIR